jgi:hypothetical protein
MTNLPDRGTWSGSGDITVTAGGDVNGVTVVKDLFGVIFLGFLTIFLLIALQRAHARNRELLIQLGQREQPQA